MPKQSLKKPALAGPAFYGKIPAHGDFISRGLTRRHVSEIDNWLTEWFENAKTGWGVSFDDNYRASQPWLFAGSVSTAVLIPSFDRVERLFPLFAMIGAGARLQHLYDIVLSVIAEQRTGDQLFECLVGIDCPSPNPDTEGWVLPDQKELSMPHPFSGENTEWMKQALQ